MKQLKRLTLTLALLIMAVGGAWADGTVYNTTVALKDLKAGDVLTDGFKLTTEKGQYIYVKGYKKDGGTAETSDYTQLNADNSTFPGGVTISESGSTYTPYADGKDANAWIVSDWKDLGSATMLYLDGYNYTPTEWSLTPDETGKTWTLAKMPASDVELQVEYYAESNLFLSKDALADKGSISVTAGDLGVQFGDDGKSANTVTEGIPMTVTYNGTKKLLGMKVEKKGAASKLASEVTTDDIFKVIASDGMIYDNIAAAESAGTVAQGLLVYVGSDTGNDTYKHGMALALKDEGDYTWSGAKDACNAKNTSTPIVGALWIQASKDQWNTMFNAVGGDCKLRDCFASAGGTNLKKVENYWAGSSHEDSGEQGDYYTFSDNNLSGSWCSTSVYYNNDYHVRACIVF
ncbi:MAG: hypothetical protein ILA25_09705 [Prevotella sp.]|nr:hypothetical protein [Prevotella sp.]MBP3850125.1 hypothetical protein [Prevotella sp.]